MKPLHGGLLPIRLQLVETFLSPWKQTLDAGAIEVKVDV